MANGSLILFSAMWCLVARSSSGPLSIPRPSGSAKGRDDPTVPCGWERGILRSTALQSCDLCVAQLSRVVDLGEMASLRRSGDLRYNRNAARGAPSHSASRTSPSHPPIRCRCLSRGRCRVLARSRAQTTITTATSRRKAVPPQYSPYRFAASYIATAFSVGVLSRSW